MNDSGQSQIDLLINEIGIGWQPLVRGLDANLRVLDPNYYIAQIKEKFGGLRYYVQGFDKNSEEAYRLIEAAEDVSFKICEDCGAPGETQSLGGWLRTLCPLCYSKEADKTRNRK